MGPSMSFIDEDLEISVQLDTSLNTVDLNSPLSNEFNLELFNSQHPIEEINLLLEDGEFVTPSLSQLQESADYIDFHNKSDDSTTEIFISPPTVSDE